MTRRPSFRTGVGIIAGILLVLVAGVLPTASAQSRQQPQTTTTQPPFSLGPLLGPILDPLLGPTLGPILDPILGPIFGPPVGRQSPPSVAPELRTMTWNVSGAKWSEAGITAKDFAQEIQRLNVDAVGFQEIRLDQFRAVRDALGFSWNGSWQAEKNRAQCLIASENCIGNGILTWHVYIDDATWKLPADEWDDIRFFQRMVIQVPGPQPSDGNGDVLFYNTHLSSDPVSLDTRAGQARRIDRQIREDLRKYGAGTPVVLVGDFNQRPWHNGMRSLRNDEKYLDSWATGWPESTTFDECNREQAGPGRGRIGTGASPCGWTATGRTKDLKPVHPTVRIDYIMTGPSAGVLGFYSRYTPWASGQNQDVLRFQKLSDHFPVLATVTLRF